MPQTTIKFALITTCTNRKRRKPTPDLCASKLLPGDLHGTLQTWGENLDKAKNITPAKDLYCGRGFSEICKTVVNNNPELWIISAGVGLITGDQQIPAYNLTVLPSAKDSIQAKILSESRFQPDQWWNRLNRKLYGTPTPIYDLISQRPDTYFIVSLSKTYISLVLKDLFLINDKDRRRIRITGLNSPEPIPESFRPLWMPYDERFDGPQSPNPGTRSDFPQRVTRHFIEEVLFKNTLGTPREHAKVVSDILSFLPPPKRIKRTTLSDEAIKQIITRRWNDAKGSGSRMLKILRHEENVACEQGRCADLYRQIKARMT